MKTDSQKAPIRGFMEISISMKPFLFLSFRSVMRGGAKMGFLFFAEIPESYLHASKK